MKHLFLFAFSVAAFAQQQVPVKLVRCNGAITGPLSVVIAFVPPGTTSRQTMCATLDPAAFVLDTSTNPPTLRAILPTQPNTTQVTGEVPAGAIGSATNANGVSVGTNPTFTLAHAPAPGTLAVFYNGIRLKLGVDYSATGNTFTFITDPTLWPQDARDLLLVDYRF
jgi:hypothetical protein